MAPRHRAPEGASASLTLLQGLPDRTRYQLMSFPAVLGSRPESDVCIELPQVAESQLRLLWVGDSLYLEDLARDRSTRVNDQPVDRVRLSNGDIIDIGPVKLLVQLTLPAARPPEDREETVVRTAWVVGFSDEFRKWWKEDLAAELDLRLESFRTAEEVLIALSRALTDRQPPAMIILDLRLPMINGINVAIAARAFELGFRRQKLIPLVFLFEPPDAASFEKVVKFCQPLRAFSPGESDFQLQELARDLAGEIGLALYS